MNFLKIIRKKSNKNLFIILIILIGFLVISRYFNGFYSHNEIKNEKYNVSKVESTIYSENVENIEEKSKNLADVIEDVTKSVVGISKLKSTGKSIFSSSDEGKMGIGTGIIVNPNGYILSNEHLTGEKFSKCYVNLEDGRSFDGTVVWSDKDLDLSITKIKAKDLPVAKLGDSSTIRVGENVYAIDNIKIKEGATMPSSYDLRNVGGKNYVTPLKDQKSLDLCWDFTTIAQAESYLLLKSGQGYSSSFPLYSTRQLDYATSSNGFNEYTNEDGVRELASGGNFLTGSSIMANGLGMVYESKMPLNYNMATKELSAVLNYGNSQYELNSSIYFPRITSTTTTSDRNDISSSNHYIRCVIPQEF